MLAAPHTSTLEGAKTEPCLNLIALRNNSSTSGSGSGLMVVTEITLVGWLISTPDTADPVLWSLAAVGAVLLGIGIFIVHRQIERRIDEIGKL